MTATPVSSTATTLPAPVMPASRVRSPPISETLWVSTGGTGRSSVTLTTPGRRVSRSSAAWSTLKVTTGSRDSLCSTRPELAASGISCRVLVTTFTLTRPPPATRSRNP
ncbi:hypothetical protein Pta02_18770 [Planobispora takensis]|uniref:Uncharacterized protein n=1 Tax=Planobispora takensis TaxID=1367882 RepID=A0A8J3T2H2_9ACTN|nr:hypothetical protein Pta02_18770 [Planobispora takensis]